MGCEDCKYKGFAVADPSKRCIHPDIDLIIENCIFDFTDSPYKVGIQMYCPCNPNFFQRLKGRWIRWRFVRKYSNKRFLAHKDEV